MLAAEPLSYVEDEVNKTTRTLVTVLSLVALAIPLTQAVNQRPASAAWSECAASHLCFFDNDAGGSPKIIDLAGWIWGYEQHFAGDSSTYGCYNFPSAANDRANSVYNHYPSGHHVVVFSGYNCVTDEPEECGSNFVVVQPGAKVTFLSNFWYCGLRDVGSSVRIRWY